MTAALEAAAELGVRATCQTLAVSRASFYRHSTSQSTGRTTRRLPSLRSLTEDERLAVLDLLTSDRFVDASPRQVWATLLDERKYICSVSTMYRLLTAHCGSVRERRNQLTHPVYAKPELLAVQPNEVWSWDITKLLGPTKWSYFYLYVILDIFSRHVVGWMVANRESATLASQLITETCSKEMIQKGQLTIHADRRSSMKSRLVAQLLVDLGVTKTHSRPHVSDDNPFSESQFRTLKYRPQFPGRFGSIQDARSFCQDFFAWYNTEHRHSGIGLHTPESVHRGLARELDQTRQHTLLAAYLAHPERFVNKPPTPPAIPDAVWINPPNLSQGDLPDTLPALH